MNKPLFSSASGHKGTHMEKVMQTEWLNNHHVPGAQPGIHMQTVNVFKRHFLCPQQNDDITQGYRHYYQKLTVDSWFSETGEKGYMHWTGTWGSLNQPVAFKAISPLLQPPI